MGWLSTIVSNPVAVVTTVTSPIVDIADSVKDAYNIIEDKVSDEYNRIEDQVSDEYDRFEDRVNAEYDRWEEDVQSSVQQGFVEITKINTGIDFIDGYFDFIGGLGAGAFGYGCEDGKSIYDKPLPAVTEDYMNRAEKLEALLGIKRKEDRLAFTIFVHKNPYTQEQLKDQRYKHFTEVVISTYSDTDSNGNTVTYQTFVPNDKYIQFRASFISYYNPPEFIPYKLEDKDLVVTGPTETHYEKYTLNIDIFNQYKDTSQLSTLRERLGIKLSDFENYEYGGPIKYSIYHLGFETTNKSTAEKSDLGRACFTEKEIDSDNKLKKIIGKYYTGSKVYTSCTVGDDTCTPIWTGYTNYDLKVKSLVEIKRKDLVTIVEKLSSFNTLYVDPREDEAFAIKVQAFALSVALIITGNYSTGVKFFLLVVAMLNFADAVSDPKMKLIMNLMAVYYGGTDSAGNFIASEALNSGVMALNIMFSSWSEAQQEKWAKDLENKQNDLKAIQDKLDDTFKDTSIRYEWLYNDQYSDIYDYDFIFPSIYNN